MTMMNLDSSLDDMIKAAPRQRRGGGGGKKGGGKKGGGEKVVPKPKPGKNAGGVRQKVIAKPRRGPSGGRSVTAMAVDAMDTWQHDMFQDGGRGPRGGGRGPQGGAKLIISNLHFNVSNQDIKELFEQVGAVKKSGVNFDEQGRSKGSAEVIFARQQDALQAIKTYNGVKLDGKPLRIELVGGAPAGGGVMLSSGITVTRPAGGGGGSRTVTFNGGAAGGRKKVVAKVVREAGGAGKGGRGAKAGGRGGKGGRGGRGPKASRAKPPTQEELDAQLDSYRMQE